LNWNSRAEVPLHD